jgi:ZIP family zinc transporter
MTRPRPLLGDLRIHNAAPAGPWPQAGQGARGLELAGFIALGIGLHLGEGLAVGAALATGSAALATYLVIGFTIHNVIEGIGIAAPLTREPTIRFHLARALAGLPAIIGTIVGTQAVSPLWTAVRSSSKSLA